MYLALAMVVAVVAEMTLVVIIMAKIVMGWNRDSSSSMTTLHDDDFCMIKIFAISLVPLETEV